jgi:hypothetical protein
MVHVNNLTPGSGVTTLPVALPLSSHSPRRDWNSRRDNGRDSLEDSCPLALDSCRPPPSPPRRSQSSKAEMAHCCEPKRSRGARGGDDKLSQNDNIHVCEAGSAISNPASRVGTFHVTLFCSRNTVQLMTAGMVHVTPSFDGKMPVLEDISTNLKPQGVTTLPASKCTGPTLFCAGSRRLMLEYGTAPNSNDSEMDSMSCPAVAVQVEFERKQKMKPGYHISGPRVENQAVSSYGGQLH